MISRPSRSLRRSRARGTNPARRLAISAVVYRGISSRMKDSAVLARETRELAVPTVLVVRPKRAAPAQVVVLPANIQPFIDSPIYARTNGYLKRWYVDIGAHVKAG